MNSLLFPILAIQGMWMKFRTEALPAADGPNSGGIGETVGREPIRIGIIGESTAAGCGVRTHDEGFPGSLGRILLERAGRPVTWQVVGQYGATARRVRYRLLPQLSGEFTVSVVLAGANDVLKGRSTDEWATDLGAVVDDLVERSERVAVAGIPPFEVFPSIPRTLRRYLADQAATFDAAAQRVCSERPNSVWVTSTDGTKIGTDSFAADGFHPSARGYRSWAETVADHVKV